MRLLTNRQRNRGRCQFGVAEQRSIDFGTSTRLFLIIILLLHIYDALLVSATTVYTRDNACLLHPSVHHHHHHLKTQLFRRDRVKGDSSWKTNDGYLSHYSSSFSPLKEMQKFVRRCEKFYYPSSSSLAVSSATYQEQKEISPSKSFYVREGRYMELGKVSKLLVNSFYKPSNLVRPYLYISELSRLQNNFPYDADQTASHSFIVACGRVEGTKEDVIIGFVDLDARPAKNNNTPPRPYLSDLAVHQDWRRRGVAKSLIIKCEERAKEWGKGELNLRVERDNDGALAMYKGLGYSSIPHHFFGHGRDTTILLRRYFSQEKDVSASTTSTSRTCSSSIVEPTINDENDDVNTISDEAMPLDFSV